MNDKLVAIRCASEMNHWMDSILIVPSEQAESIEQSLRERFSSFKNECVCYGDLIREVASGAEIESLKLCDYDERTDEPTKAWEKYCDRIYQKMPVIEIDI